MAKVKGGVNHYNCGLGRVFYFYMCVWSVVTYSVDKRTVKSMIYVWKTSA